MMARSVIISILTATCLCCDREEPPAKDTSQDSARRQEVMAFWSALRAARDRAAKSDWGGARDSVSEALRIDPDHEGALYLSGNIAFEMGRYADARDAWDSLVSSHPHSASGFSQLGSLYSSGVDPSLFDLGAAREAFEKLYDLNKESSEATVRLGEVDLLQGKTSDALGRFERAVAFDPGNREAWLLKGFAHWLAGDRVLAEAAYKELEASGVSEERPFASEEGDTRAGHTPMMSADIATLRPFAAMVRRAEEGVDAASNYRDAKKDMDRLLDMSRDEGEGGR